MAYTPPRATDGLSWFHRRGTRGQRTAPALPAGMVHFRTQPSVSVLDGKELDAGIRECICWCPDSFWSRPFQIILFWTQTQGRRGGRRRVRSGFLKTCSRSFRPYESASQCGCQLVVSTLVNPRSSSNDLPVSAGKKWGFSFRVKEMELETVRKA
jgi:hypothetical protein